MWHQRFSIYAVCIALFTICASAEEVSPWRWTCQDRLCVKTRNDPQNKDPVLSLEACKMFCTEYGLLWPKPTGKTDLGNFLSKININNIDVKLVNEGRSADLTEEAGNVNNIDVQQANDGRSADLMEEAGNRFKNMVSLAIPEGITPKSTGKAVSVQLFNDNPDVREFSLDMDESYTLRVQAASGDRINATIRAGTFFGLRHGLETLSQLIVYDDIRNHMLLINVPIHYDVTKKLYNYILNVIDGYTKFVWIYPVKTVTSKETVEKLKLHQKDYGNPRRIVTDRGTAFTGGEFTEYCREEEIEHITITTGIPRGNGQVERMNRIIISALTKMCIEEPGHWYKYVSKLQRVINSTYQRSINTTPSELLTGVKLRMKEDMKVLEFLEEESRLEFMQKRDESRREAKAQILRIQEENRKTFNKKRKEGEKYKQGDLVAIQRTQLGNALKLKPKFLGPYTITKELGKDRYEVEKVDRGKEGPIKTTSGVDYMKRWL